MQQTKKKKKRKEEEKGEERQQMCSLRLSPSAVFEYAKPSMTTDLPLFVWSSMPGHCSEQKRDGKGKEKEHNKNFQHHLAPLRSTRVTPHVRRAVIGDFPFHRGYWALLQGSPSGFFLLWLSGSQPTLEWLLACIKEP